MKEDFLYFLWKYQLFDHQELQTQCGLTIQIKKTGYQNFDAGPDFSAAHLVLDSLEWFGNVEMHVKSSEWFEHGHQNDQAYDSVVLHVVWDYNIPVIDSSGREIPTLALAKLTEAKYLTNYEQLNKALVEIPCQKRLLSVPSIYLKSELEQQLINRLERKTVPWTAHQVGELKIVFYELLAQSFGFKVNADPFRQVAEQLPLSIVLKHRGNLQQLESLFFGMSGMLSTQWQDDYPKQLLKEWDFLKHKYQLPEVIYLQWKFSKMRPPNFPTIKLAQFALLMADFQDLFDAINTNKPLSFVEVFFQKGTSCYWNEHYVFDKSSQNKTKQLGRASFNSIVINAIVPFVYLKYKKEERQEVFDYLIDLLESLPPEHNHKIDLFVELGIKPQSAFDSQALLELLDYKCLPKKCLTCKVGNQLVRQK